MDWICPTKKDGRKCKLCLKKGASCRYHASWKKKKANHSGEVSSEEEEISFESLSVPQRQEFFTGKRVLSIGGCFCPPHAGHYNMVDELIRRVDPDVFVVTSTNRDEFTRHGTPLKHTKETWDAWGTILARKHNSTYIFGNDMIWDGSMKNISEFVESGVWEKQMPVEYRDNPLERLSLEDKSLGYLYQVPRDFDGYYKYHLQRKGGLSATEFTKCLQDLTRDCQEFVPNDVPGKQEYIDHLRREYGEALRGGGRRKWKLTK